MWLLDTKDNDTPILHKVPEHELEPPKNVVGGKAAVQYAILSHTWGADEEEITFDEMLQGRFSRSRPGWFKVQQSRRQGAKDGYDYVWIDTCCIDKKSSAELQESINSMYYWYS